MPDTPTEYVKGAVKTLKDRWSKFTGKTPKTKSSKPLSQDERIKEHQRMKRKSQRKQQPKSSRSYGR
jgi:hypothetical protein